MSTRKTKTTEISLKRLEQNTLTLTALHALSLAVNRSTQNLDQLLELTARGAVGISEAIACSITIYAEKDRERTIVAYPQNSQVLRNRPDDFKNSFWSSRAPQNLLSALNPDVKACFTFFPSQNAEEIFVNADPQNVIVAALKAGHERIGLLTIFYALAPENPVNANDVEVLSVFANQSAIAIRNALLYEDLEKANKELHRLNSVKNEFISMVSHELRSPLTALGAAAQMITTGAIGPVTDQQKRMLQLVSSSSERLNKLVDDLLSLSRIETGGLEFNPVVVDVPEQIAQVVELWQPKIQTKGLTIQTRFVPNLYALIDRDCFTQVITNLISNAVKYTLEGGHIDIKGSYEPGQKKITLTISDTGIGLKPEELARLFTEFYRVRNPLAGNTEGSGLGLKIVRSLLKAQNANIKVESVPNQGSVFTVILPAALKEARF